MIRNPLTGRKIKVGGKTHRTLMRGGTMMSLDKDANGNYTETYDLALDVDEIPLWDYRPDAFHWFPKDWFTTNGAQHQRRIIPEKTDPITKELIVSNDHFTIQQLFRAIVPQKGSPYLLEPKIDTYIRNGIKAVYFDDIFPNIQVPGTQVPGTQEKVVKNKQKLLIDDIVDHQFGNVSPFVAGTSNFKTVLKFFVWRYLDSKLKDGVDCLLIIYTTSRGLNITYTKDNLKKYNRNFQDEYIDVHNISDGYNETIVPAGITSSEIDGIFNLTLERTLGHDGKFYGRIITKGFKKGKNHNDQYGSVLEVDFRHEIDNFNDKVLSKIPLPKYN